MQERPIIFNTSMVQAILDGRKTQTRRVMKYQCVKPWFNGVDWSELGNDDTVHFKFICPYGQPGDLLYVRETHYIYGSWSFYGTIGGPLKWKFRDLKQQPVLYSDNPPYKIETGKLERGYFKRPSIFHKKEYARIWLKIKDIRVERVNDISEEDAMSEGIKPSEIGITNKTCFRVLWDFIYENRGYGWAANPWVWVVEFEVKQDKR